MPNMFFFSFQKKKKQSAKTTFFCFFFLKPETGFVFFSLKPESKYFFFFQNQNANQCFWYIYIYIFLQEQSVLSLLHLLHGLQRESKDCKKDHYKNKTRKPNNTKKSSLVSVTISLKQIHRLPGARRSHFDICFPGYNGGQAVPD